MNQALVGRARITKNAAALPAVVPPVPAVEGRVAAEADRRLVVAFASDVVREPVACAGGIELVCGVLLLLRAREEREWAETRRRLVREGTLAKDK